MESGVELSGLQYRPRNEEMGNLLVGDTVYDLTFTSFEEKMNFLNKLIELRKSIDNGEKHENSTASFSRHDKSISAAAAASFSGHMM